MTADRRGAARATEELRTAGDVVRWAFRQAIRSDDSTVDLPVEAGPALTEALTHHRGWGVFHAACQRVRHVPEPVLRRSGALQLTRSLQELARHADLQSLDGALTAGAVPWIVVKGPVLAGLYYAAPEQRPYRDLDVLVRPQDLRAAVRLLSEAGFAMLDRNWTLALARMSGEVHLVGPQGTVVDLHWSLQNREHRRRRLGVGSETLFAGARHVDLAGVRVLTLGWSDTVVHLALHAAGDGADRLIWLSDVARVLDRSPDSWDELVARCRTWRAGAAVQTVLQRTATELQVVVPAPVLLSLARNPLAVGVEAAVSRRHPVHELTSRANPLARWTRARLEPGTTARAALLRGRSAAATPFRESADNPYSLLHDDGGPDGLDRYLRAVEATAR
jgi:hypothetical protein